MRLCEWADGSASLLLACNKFQFPRVDAQIVTVPPLGVILILDKINIVWGMTFFVYIFRDLHLTGLFFIISLFLGYFRAKVQKKEYF